MEISVEYKDTNGIIINQRQRLTRLAFVKHLAIAGQRYLPHPQKLIRSIAMLFHYSFYMQRHSFSINRFSEPPIELSDPTEKGQFSNLAGKAIADFLSKRIHQSKYTVNYEAAMRRSNPPIPLTVNGRQAKRPDLLAFITDSKLFAIEAKGFSGGCGSMGKHKHQSQTGKIKVEFTVASVAYDLYNVVKVKYHDPIKNDTLRDGSGLLRRLTQDYYSGLSEFLNEKYFAYSESVLNGEKFYEVELKYDKFKNLISDEFPLRHFWQFEILEYYRPRLILPILIRDYAQSGLTGETKPFIFDGTKEPDENIYIDNDRVGLRIRM